MLYVGGIGLKYGDRQLLKDVDFMLTKKDRAGLIGKNGAGKSTLLRIITNQQSPDTGGIQVPKSFSIGFLKQDLHFEGNNSVIEETKTCFSEVIKIEAELARVNEDLGDRTDFESNEYMALIEELSDLNDRLHIMSGGSIEAKCERVLRGLGFKDDDFDKKVSQFSGGWQMRIELAKLLLTQPDLLLLDEPTNHLDIESIIWLEEYLLNYVGIVMVISHDKQFLDNVCNKTLELESGRVTVYPGNYSKYLTQREGQREIMQNAFENQQKMIAQKEKTISRFMAKATKTSMAQSMQKQLDKVERIEIPDVDNKVFNLNFGNAPRSGRIVMDIKNISKSFGTKEVLKNINLVIERGEKIAFVGQNGQGKTTLAKILVNQLAKESGEVSLGANVFLSYYAQNQSELIDTSKTVLSVMEDVSPPEQRTNIRNILGAFLFSGEDADKKVSVLSGGERARLAMAMMILRPSNLIIMDEPTNHLDIQSKEVLKSALLKYDGTIIIVSHDREFLEGLSTKVYEFKDKGIKEYLGDINYFLDKKKLDNMREIDTKQKVQTAEDTPAIPTPVAPVLDWEEQKKIKKRIQYLERDIEKAESNLKAFTEKLHDPNFYMNPDFSAVSKKHKEEQEKLDALMIEWDSLAEKLVG